MEVPTLLLEPPMVTQEQFPTGHEQQSSEPVMPPAAPPSLVPKIDLDDHQWYLNRELTWLGFNRRVLHEAEDERTPLLERLKFIAIVSSNMDEFFMKRIGGLKQQIGAGMRELTLDGRTPRQQVQECHAFVRELEAHKDELLRRVSSSWRRRGSSSNTMGAYAEGEKTGPRLLPGQYLPAC